MGNPLSNPTPSSSKSAYPGSSIGTTRRVAGSRTRHDGSRMNHGGPGATGGKGGTPEAGRAAQDAARGTVHGQPRTGQRDQSKDVAPFSGPRAAGGGQ
jgi:hypothetical protein